MVTPELLDFLRTQLAGGMSREEIEHLLVSEGGWEKVDVEEGLITVGQPAITPNTPSLPTKTLPESSAPTTFQVTETTPAQPEIASSEQVILQVRSERPVVLPEHEDFLGILSSSPVKTPTTEGVVQESQELSNTIASADRVVADPQRVEIVEQVHPVPKDESRTPNLMEMLSAVAAPASLPSSPSESAATPQQSVTPIIKFDMSSLLEGAKKVDTPTLAPVASEKILQQVIPPALEALRTEAPSAPLVENKNIETHSVAELWLASDNTAQQPLKDDKKENELRSSLSSRRTMVSDMLLRGKGATIQGLPALLPAVEANPMPTFRDEGNPSDKKQEIQPKIVKEQKVISPEEVLAKKQKTKKIITVFIGSLVAILLLAGGGVLYVSMRGPDVATLLSTTMANFYAATSFAYTGNSSSDITLTTTVDGVTRNGSVKFSFPYSGQLKNSKKGYGDGNHNIKWNGGLKTEDFAWSTDIESDIRIFAENLYFHVKSYPLTADIDPEVFKIYWVKVDLDEIYKELSLGGINTTQILENSGSGQKTIWNNILMDNMPFVGGEKIGTEVINSIDTTHIKLKNDPEKMYSLVSALYYKYTGTTLTLDEGDKLNLKNALEKITVDVWVDEKSSTLVQVQISGNFDDDISNVRVKGPISFSFNFSGYGALVTVSEPSPFLTVGELRTRMDDYKKEKELRNRDAVRINILTVIESSLASYKESKGRFPTKLSELRLENFLATTTVPDSILVDYTYSSYVKVGDFTKANKCTPKSKICGMFHLGINLEDINSPVLANDSDQISDVHGTDSSGCSIEREKACYDIVTSASSTPNILSR